MGALAKGRTAPPAVAPNLAAALRRAAGHLVAGGVIVAPDAQAYRLMALANRPEALERLRARAGREATRPMPVLVAAGQRFPSLARPPRGGAAILARHFWPGPLTLLLERGEAASPGLVGESPWVAMRACDHPVVAHLCRTVGPLAAVRAPGDPAPPGDDVPRHAAAVDPAVLGPDVLMVDAGPCPDEGRSTVVRVVPRHRLELVREGRLGLHQLAAVLSAIRSA